MRSEILLSKLVEFSVFGLEGSLDKEEFSSLKHVAKNQQKKEQHKEFVAHDLV